MTELSQQNNVRYYALAYAAACLRMLLNMLCSCLLDHAIKCIVRNYLIINTGLLTHTQSFFSTHRQTIARTNVEHPHSICLTYQRRTPTQHLSHVPTSNTHTAPVPSALLPLLSLLLLLLALPPPPPPPPTAPPLPLLLVQLAMEHCGTATYMRRACLSK